ncbi:hypothetical protein BSK64_18445 [Paenibacillus odorifer]|nr:hypothetical protein BSK64_18445 [Paenibacillus odorifer]
MDNNSTDFSMEFFQERKFENTKIIKNKKNDGFGKANNIGVNYSKGEFLVLLNSDTIVEETNFLNLLSAFEKNDEMGILSVKILNEDNTIQSVGFDLPSLRNELKLNLLFWNFSFIKNIRYKNYKNKQIFKVGWVSGCFMVMRQKDYHLVGGFDEKIFMYAEDIDLCYRLSKQKKYSYIFDETSIYHLHGKSGDKKNVKLKKMFENKSNFYYVIEKNNIFSKRKINISKFSFCMHAILLVSIKKIRNFVTRH